jgi:hypothetical protein
LRGIDFTKVGFKKSILSIIITLSLILQVGFLGSFWETVLAEGSPPEPLDVNPTTLQEIINKVTEQHVEKYITDLQNFGTRYVYTTQCNLSAQYIFDEFSNYSALSVESDYFWHNGYLVRNIIATLPGLNESNDKVYVIGGHYDSISNDPWNNAPGADDDASGTAVALEAAKILSEYRFESTIIFTAWTAEEVGLVGSSHWAKNAEESDMDIGAYLNFDMIGYDPDNKMGLDIGYNDNSIWISDEMKSINTNYSIGLNITTGQGGGNSDHASFWGWGYHAVTCIESEFNTPNYHTVNDTVDKLNMEFDKKVTQLGIATLAKLAGLLTPGEGKLYLDSSAYQPTATVGIKLYESDLNANPLQAEQVIVEIESSTETLPETVTLTETGLNTSVFWGTINLALGAPALDGELQVTEGDIITARYNDVSPSGVRVAQADVDGIPPVISNVAATPDVNSAIITWTTDEISDSRVYFGLSPSLGIQVYDSEMVTSHSVELNGLEPSLIYYFDVKSSDVAGNTQRDDNASAHYNFKTLLGITVRANLGYVGYVKESDPSGNYFDGPDILVGHGAQGIYHGAAQFYDIQFPNDATITDAKVEFYGKRWHYTGSGGNWNLKVLDPVIDSGWQSHGYTDIHDATVQDTVSPMMLNDDLLPKQWNTFNYGSGQFSALKSRLLTGNISYRLDGPQSGYYLFIWDTGNDGESYGPEFAPRLVVTYETVGDTMGPVISDHMALPNPTYGVSEVTLTAVISDGITGGSNINEARYYNPVSNSWITMDPADGMFDSPSENLEKLIDISSWPDGTYEIYIRGLDEAGNWGDSISITLTKKPTFELQLQFGWNLISIPIDLTGTSIHETLASIAGDYDSLQYFDASDSLDSWKHNHSIKSSDLNDFKNIDHTKGFWIHITNPSGVLLECPGSPFLVNQMILLHPGWNLVGYPSSSDRMRPEALNNLTFDLDVDAIWTYDSQMQKWEQVGESDYLEVGRGYYIYSKDQKMWEVPL